MASRAKKPPLLPEPFDLVVVEWEDCQAFASAQHESPAAAVAAYTPCIRRTAGYWGGRTKAVVVVCTDDDRTAGNNLAIAGPMYIPAPLVRSVVVVSRTELVYK